MEKAEKQNKTHAIILFVIFIVSTISSLVFLCFLWKSFYVSIYIDDERHKLTVYGVDDLLTFILEIFDVNIQLRS